MVGGQAGFLLDTNVVSELMKPRPSARVVAWVAATPEPLLYLSAITIGEVRRGIDLLDEADPRRGALQSWLNHDVRLRFAGRILSFDEGVAERWGQVEALARKRRVTLPTIDAQLAATALHHGLTFVTRNVTDVVATGVPVFNPWPKRDDA
ncbi:MAG: type II toxin-antitoxin system VapC family toxin [Acidobacteria bacterium]|nr:type II toxin-antitoxin system VapC family toxin [Acidobacteriota bacterium]